MLKPRCRHCETRVSYFGEVCSDCAGADLNVGLEAITRADLAALAQRAED